MKYLIGIAGIIVILALALLVSNNRKKVRYPYIFIMLGLQFLLAFLLLNTTGGSTLIGGIASIFDNLLKYAAEGANFVFGGLLNENKFSFFIMVLIPIVFISALIGIMQYIHLPSRVIIILSALLRKIGLIKSNESASFLGQSFLTMIIKGIGILLSKVNGMGKLESYNAVASAILGQSEVFISVKKSLGFLPQHRLYTLCTSAMSTISMSIVGAYMTLLDPVYVVTAIVLNLFGGFIIASMINPYRVDPEEDVLEVVAEEKQSFFEMLGEYILDGFKVAIIVGAMLVGFIAIIAMINAIFSYLFGISFQDFLGYVFSPLAFLVGIPWDEAVSAGSLMGTKLVSNEFVAMDQLKQGIDNGTFLFSEHTKAIISVFLVSFANFSSIGIISGAIKALNPQQGNVASRFGLKLLYGATLVSFLSAAVVGLIHH
ncbi:NupC/NupG family nucleoside CNT transporter [Budviciaceae bacterium CWB-B4]|uniref:NupC/NupG family nucleoside CNT transporter n=1 Tax=Limnobaculum xujianqingii TaxID=2738837 RepID=A0A9D7AJV2_9GAMM|nr:nucleoside transporter C-terminal domain-containing protein [Limnobaculum xujianqingii]MBK5074106.1 NupC/NupG family nucleoside CNT transporter [Limnobaculum xujianqingii]MBK5177415.1 NupC/NupG family nucleoside CNT transporter [Limnobaculum xujianqingii]